MQRSQIAVWLDDPELVTSFESEGIPVVTVRVRKELAERALMSVDPTTDTQIDPAFRRIAADIQRRWRAVLGGAKRQTIDAGDLDGDLLLAELFGSPS